MYKKVIEVGRVSCGYRSLSPLRLALLKKISLAHMYSTAQHPAAQEFVSLYPILGIIVSGQTPE